MIFIIIGMSGSGKGTQARLLSQRYGYIPTISTGALLRIKYDENNPDGIEAERYWGKGKWVPDKLMFKILEARLEEDDCCNHGFILDAFPRTSEQINILDRYLKRKGRQVDQVIYLRVGEDEVVKRMIERARDDIKIFGKARRDENPEAIKERLRFHHLTIDPILEEYKKRGILLDINGDRPIGEIHEDLMRQLRKKKLLPSHKNKSRARAKSK